MKVLHFKFLFLAFSIISCTDDTNSLQFPVSYDYHSGIVRDQSVFAVVNGLPVKLNQNTGSFTSIHKSYKDTINAILDIIFEDIPKITSFELASESLMKSTVVDQGVTEISEATVTISGTKISGGGNDVVLRFSEDYSELYLCGVIQTVKVTSSGGLTYYDENFDFCTTNESLKVAENIIKDKPASLRYDTIGVSFVDLVYRKK